MSLLRKATINGSRHYLSILIDWEKDYLAKHKKKINSQDFENILISFTNLEKLYNVSNKETGDEEVCRLLSDFADHITYLSQLDFSTELRIHWFKLAIEIAEQTQWHLPLSRHYNNLGLTYWRAHDAKQALENFELAYDFAIKVNDDTAKINAMGNIANIVQREQPDKAIEYLNKVLEIVDDDSENKICALTSLGLAHRHKQQYKKALSFYEEALSKLESRSDILAKARTLGNIGVIYAITKDFESAETTFRRIIQIGLDEAKDFLLAGRAYGNLGNVYMDQEKHEDALEYLLEYKRLASQTGDIDGLRIALNDLADCYIALGNESAAKLSREEANLVATTLA